MNSYAILRMEKRKIGDVGRICNHHERLKETGAKRRKESIVLQDCLITASPKWIKSKSDEDQREYFNRAYEFMEKKIGKENKNI